MDQTFTLSIQLVFFFYFQSIIRFIKISKLLLEEGEEEKAGGDGDQEVS